MSFILDSPQDTQKALSLARATKSKLDTVLHNLEFLLTNYDGVDDGYESAVDESTHDTTGVEEHKGDGDSADDGGDTRQYQGTPAILVLVLVKTMVMIMANIMMKTMTMSIVH